VDDREYSLWEHLAELRKRLGYALAGVGIITVFAFIVSNEMLSFLRQPMDDMLKAVHGPSARFVIISPAEYLIAQMKVAFVAAIFVGSPWVLYQIWLFVAPGLYPHEKRYVTWFVWAGAFFFVAGGAFAYVAVFPAMFKFFVESLPADIMMTPSISEHFSFTLKMLLAFGVVFETPVVIVVLSLAGIIDPTSLGKYRRYVVVIAFIVGAVLTPTPDILSQVLLAGPLLVLYEGGVLISRLLIKVRGTPLTREERARKDAEARGEPPPPRPGAAPPDDANQAGA
jgi:sec-independent protein translocase protein TatC